MSKMNPWVKGAFILSVAGIITKILSAGYRVPFQNMVGDRGFYIYQQVYPFYGMIVAFMMFGFPMAISKLYAEGNRKKEDFTSIFLGLCVIGFSGFLLLYFGSPLLANWMKDEELAPLFQTLSYLFLLFPVISMKRGLFQGKGNMVPTALSQIGEQLVRVITILMGAFLLTKANRDLYEVGNAAVFGSITGGIMALFILAVYSPWQNWIRWAGLRIDWGFMKSFIGLGIIFSLNTLLFIFLQLADSLQLYQLLLAEGESPFRSKELKGIYDRGQPLIQLGVVLATSFSLALVPGLAKLKSEKKQKEIKKYIQLSVKMSVVIGMAATVGYALIMEPLNEMLFETNEGTDVLIVLSASVVLGSISMTGFGIMQGLGIHRPLIWLSISVFLGKVILNFLFIPLLGTLGAAISTVTILILLTTGIIRILSAKGYKLKASPAFIKKMAISLAGMAATVLILLFIMQIDGWFSDSPRAKSAFQAITSSMAGAAVYFWLLMRLEVFSKEELHVFPRGKNILTLFTLRK
ncbi:MAG TPA: polysaccharide biosynthesis protein [Bacillus sp. (in: firmicutes)]|uniref:putative polysaccharide biosynthesis protein n=1 Tax=Bacillus litorisediminis TaxID=2922713 RepID=UPI001FAF6B7B|nr:polysaccharide biosynthesis protein [Bacillus litorisediminis]HWO76045.1 polysaccharide biosynthesis protein [Bacillus sp. (in: firmicutes)]